MGSKARAATIYALQDCKDLWRVNISYRSFRQPRKHIIIQTGRRFLVLTYLNNSLSLIHPAFGDELK
jgi:hypothetical protein